VTELPPGWAWATLPDLIVADGVFSDGDWVETKDQDPDGEVRLTQLADIGEGVFRDRSSRFMTAEAAERLGCTYLNPGDVLVARMPDPLGRACLYPGGPRRAVTAVDVCIVRPGSGSVDPRWLMWWLNAPHFRAEVAARQSGTTRKRISRKNLASIRFPLPPLVEQRRIVAMIEEQLSRLDAAERSLNLATARARRAKVLILNAAFSAVHETVPLHRVAEVRLGRQRSPKNHVGPSMRPYLRAANVTWDGLKLDDVKEMNFTPAEAATYELKPGDVLLAEASGSASEVGKPVVWRGEILGCCFQNTLIRVRSESELPEYLRLVFLRSALLGQFAQAAPGVGIHHLGSSRLAAWSIPVVDSSEQAVLVSNVEHAFSLVDAAQTRLADVGARAASLRRAILAQAFRGELVPQDPNDESAGVLLDWVAAERSAASKGTRKRRVRTVT
jgi:type I restriction enzyme, S subunit